MRAEGDNRLLPDWEPFPWKLTGEEADIQEAGFQKRALKAISWTAAPWQDFPPEGIFGQPRDWFVSNDIRFYATADEEDLVLVQLAYHGFPDPPEWGLWSRPKGKVTDAWTPWGHVPILPTAWVVPGESS
jgi:hypothetical protein